MKIKSGEMSSYSTDSKTIRQFALILLCVSIIMALLFTFKFTSNISYIFWVFSIMAVCLLVFPLQFRWFYNGWVKASKAIGSLTTYTILIIVWYFVISPVGIIRRILRKHTLPFLKEENVESYWIEREEPLQHRERYSKRY